MDEARLGLKPILAKVWAPAGQRPVAYQRPAYKWLYVYGFVRPTTGETEWFLLPSVSVVAFSLVLEHWAKAIGVGADKHAVLVLDRAGWHCSKDLVVPEGVHLVHLPAYSPELQPAERLWPPLREALANRLLNRIEEVETIVGNRCVELSDEPEQIRRLTSYHWWSHDDGLSIMA